MMPLANSGASALPSRNLYVFALGAVAVAAAIRWLLGPLLADRLPFLTFYLAVGVTAWYGGLRPALLATAVGFVAGVAFFVPTDADFSMRQLWIAQWDDWLRYFILSVAFSIFGEAKWEAVNRAEMRRETLQVTLSSIGDGVVVTDTEGRVRSINPVAEALTGWKQRDAVGLPLEDVFHIVNEETRAPVESPVTNVLEHGRIVALANHTLLIAKDGTERPIRQRARLFVRGRHAARSRADISGRDRDAHRRTLSAASEARKSADLEPRLTRSYDRSRGKMVTSIRQRS